MRCSASLEVYYLHYGFFFGKNFSAQRNEKLVMEFFQRRNRTANTKIINRQYVLNTSKLCAECVYVLSII